jgi:hypothetical protein
VPGLDDAFFEPMLDYAAEDRHLELASVGLKEELRLD